MPNRYLFSCILLLIGVLLIFVSFRADEHVIAGFGSIKSSRGKLSGVSMKIYQGEALVQQVVSGRNGSYAFFLKFNSAYKIELAKEGFIKQFITIDTHAPNDAITYSEEFLWEPDLELYPYIDGMRQDEFDFPIAEYAFDNELFRFALNKQYDGIVQDTLQETKAIIEEFTDIAYAKSVQTADSLFQLEQFEASVLALQNAEQCKPGVKLTSEKLKRAKKELKKKVSVDEAYDKALQSGDGYFASKDFPMAIKAYQTAIIYKPKENYPVEQLYRIDSIKSYQWIALNDSFNTMVMQADAFYDALVFDTSKYYYNQALAIFPGKYYPQQQVNKIDSTLDAIEKQQKEQAALAAKLEKESLQKATKENQQMAKPAVQLVVAQKQVLADSSQPLAIERQKTGTPTKKQGGSPLPDLATKTDTLRTIPAANSQMPPNERAELSIEKLTAILAEKVELSSKEETAELYEQLGQAHQHEFELGKALGAYQHALAIKKETGDKDGEAGILTRIAGVMYDSGSYNQALDIFEESLQLAQEIDNKQQSSDILLGMATVLESSFQYDEAIEKLDASYKLKQSLGDTLASNEIAKNMGNIYFEQQDYAKAAKILESTLEVDKRLHQKDEVATTLNALGATYYEMEDLSKAEQYFNQSLHANRENKNLREQSISLNNIGNINFDFSKYAKAIEYYEQSLKIKQQINFSEGIASTLHNIGNAYYAQKNYTKALEYYTSSQEAARETSYNEVIWRNLEAFAKTYASMGDFKKALDYYQQYTHSKYEIRSRQQQITELRQQYEVSKIAVKSLKRELQKQNRLAQYEAERNRKEFEFIQLEMKANLEKLRRQRNIIITFIIGSLLIMIFLVVITQQYRQKQKAYRIVAEQKKHIEDGISYAARIQAAVLPPIEFIEKYLPECFILNLPRDIVSGDFYWAARHHTKSVVAVADCTGHGVPGGFMSMLGVSILNEIISTDANLEAHDILMQLRQRVMTALHQKEEKTATPDGMDISLLVFDESMKKAQFCGAYHTLYLIKKGELETVKGNRMPIGHHFSNKVFTSTNIELHSGDMIYMTSDGIVNQIGQKTNNRFMVSRLKGELASIFDLPLADQKRYLEGVIGQWQGSMEQTDDILIMGLRIT